MGVFKNGEEIKVEGNRNSKENKGLFNKFKTFIDELEEEDFDCCEEDIDDEDLEDEDFDEEDDCEEENIIKQFKVLHMSFIGDGKSTYKIIVLQELETNKRYFLEVNVYNYDATDEDDAKLIDIITLLEGDTVEIEMEEFEEELDKDYFVRVSRISI